MSHFALINDKNIVYQVVYFDNDIKESDIESHFKETGVTGIRTSYNTKKNRYYGPDGGVAFRKNFAVIGGEYRYDLDGFIYPKPFNSWTLDEETGTWEPPIPLPDDYLEKRYYWNEEEQLWKEN